MRAPQSFILYACAHGNYVISCVWLFDMIALGLKSSNSLGLKLDSQH